MTDHNVVIFSEYSSNDLAKMMKIRHEVVVLSDKDDKQ